MNFNQPKTGRGAALREGREGVEEPCRGKQRLSCWLRYWLNFKRLCHYQVSYKMKNFRLLYQQTTPVTLFLICFCLFLFVVVFFSVAKILWETHARGRELNLNAHKPLTLTRGPHTQLQMTWRAAFCTSESLSKLPSAQRSRSLEKIFLNMTE